VLSQTSIAILLNVTPDWMPEKRSYSTSREKNHHDQIASPVTSVKLNKKISSDNLLATFSRKISILLFI
jgi:hypothetical protein